MPEAATKKYRHLAAEVRTEANKVVAEDHRAALLKIATGYEELAKSLERQRANVRTEK
jgi:ribosomal protein L7Ae-like RNA K-turn-binding protein